MFDMLQNLRTVIDAPPAVLLACATGLLVALHFASSSTDEVKGARCDQVVREAKAAAVKRPEWLKRTGIGLGLAISGGSYMHLQDPSFWPLFVSNLPF